ncbi:MAG: hypothetical protein R3C56_23295 [Pirellulaceae bacterium]
MRPSPALTLQLANTSPRPPQTQTTILLSLQQIMSPPCPTAHRLLSPEGHTRSQKEVHLRLTPAVHRIDSDTLTYQWDLDGDNVFGEAGEPTSAIATVTWATLASLGATAEGVHTIRVQK